MELERAQGWLSIAVLTLGIAVPLRGVEIKTSASDPGAMSGMAWDGGCRAAYGDGNYPEGMPDEMSHARESCSMGSAVGVRGGEAAELSGGGWRIERLEEKFGHSGSIRDGSTRQVGSAQAASFVADLDALPPDETPPRAKVPEPATLILLGAGMLTMARVSRMKRLPQKLWRMTAARFSSAQRQPASGD